MIYLAKDNLDTTRHAGQFGCMVAHLFAEFNVARYTDIRLSIEQQVRGLVDQLPLLQQHSILVVVHARDYVINDWRAIPVFPFLYNGLMSIEKVHFLSTISMFNGECSSFKSYVKRRHGYNRPFFPFRVSTEVSLFLIHRNDRQTFDHWTSEADMLNHQRKVNVWRSSRMSDSYAPAHYEYKTLLDMFCHPTRRIIDVAPHCGGFAVAALDLGREYVGVYTDDKMYRAIKSRLTILQDSDDAPEDRTLPTSDRPRKLKKDGNVLGWRGR